MADGFRLRDLTDLAEKVAAPVVTPDSRALYYFTDESHLAKPRILLKRLSLEDFRTEVVTVFDSVVPGVGRRPRAGGDPVRGMGGSASIRADGRMLCAGFNFVGDDGEDHFAPVFVDLQTLAIHGFAWEPYSWRVGGTYFPGSDPAHLRHLFFVRSHRSQHWDLQGNYTEKWYSDVRIGTLHVVDEDGTMVATVPIGGPGEGVDHPYWRGGWRQ